LAFPEDQDIPTCINGELFEPCVPFLVSPELLNPEILACARNVSELAPLVLVPEAPVNKDDLATAWEGHIWPTWRGFPLETKTVTELVEKAPDNAFWLSVHPSNLAHVGTAIGRGHLVEHRRNSGAS
jgi:hypothetical protein